LKAGFTTPSYDGQNFFDLLHPVTGDDGVTVTNVANTDGGAGTPWFLPDTSRAIRPLIWQTRTPDTFQTKDRESDDNVFLQDEYLCGIRARANAGFGLWQLARGSKQTLNAANSAAARAAMAGFKADGGKILGIKPNLAVVTRSPEQAARDLVKAPTAASGASNSWYQSADLVVTPYLI
jgi:phage major head subunit gpT-like protein